MILHKTSSTSNVNNIEDHTNFSNENVIIRWGYIGSRGIEGITYNSATAISTSANKGLARDILHQAGVPVPLEQGYPLIGRTATHHAGHGFYYCKNERDKRRAIRNGAIYFSSFYPKTREYRVHIAHGKVLLIQEKIPDCETRQSSKTRWNSRFGYTFQVVRWNDYRIDIVQLAISAVNAMGLDFGAVDILADPTNNALQKAVVCEINTAPAVEGYTAQRYAEYFDFLNMITDDVKIPHFETALCETGKDYALTHNELG